MSVDVLQPVDVPDPTVEGVVGTERGTQLQLTGYLAKINRAEARVSFRSDWGIAPGVPEGDEGVAGVVVLIEPLADDL